MPICRTMSVRELFCVKKILSGGQASQSRSEPVWFYRGHRSGFPTEWLCDRTRPVLAGLRVIPPVGFEPTEPTDSAQTFDGGERQVESVVTLLPVQPSPGVLLLSVGGLQD